MAFLLYGATNLEYDREKVDEMVLALMWLVIHGDKYGARAWKSFDWVTLDRLYEKGRNGREPVCFVRRTFISGEL